MAAPMLPSRIESPPQTLSSVPVGGCGYVLWTEIEVDQTDLATYVNREAQLYPKPDYKTVRINREADGLHLIIHDQGTIFKPKMIRDFRNLALIVTIQEEIQPAPLDKLLEDLRCWNQGRKQDSPEGSAS